MSQTRNTAFEITSGSSMMEASSSNVGTFRPDDFLVGVLKKFNEPVPDSFKGKDVIYIIEVYADDKKIHQHAFKKKAPSSAWWKFNLIPDPESSVDISFRIDWNGAMARNLAGLKSGIHLLKIKAFLELDGQRIQPGYGEINFDNTKTGTVDLKKRGEEIDKKSNFDAAKEMDEWVKKNGGWDTFKKEADAEMSKREKEAEAKEAADYYSVIAKNDCLQTITVVVNDKQTYTIDGKATSKIKVMRGKEGDLKVNGRTIAIINEKMDKTTVLVCPK